MDPYLFPVSKVLYGRLHLHRPDFYVYNCHLHSFQLFYLFHMEFKVEFGCLQRIRDCYVGFSESKESDAVELHGIL